MSFDWSGYLTLAQHLLSKADELPDQEAAYRSVTSRAYYAVFCMARNHVRDMDGQQFHGNDHQQLQVYLKKHPQKARKKLGSQLQALHQHRIKADYYDNLDEPAVNKAGRAGALAESIAGGLAQLFS